MLARQLGSLLEVLPKLVTDLDSARADLVQRSLSTQEHFSLSTRLTEVAHNLHLAAWKFAEAMLEAPPPEKPSRSPKRKRVVLDGGYVITLSPESREMLSSNKA